MHKSIPAFRRSRLAMVSVLAMACGAAALAARGPVQAGPEPLLLTGIRILDTRAGGYGPASAVLIVGDRIDRIFGQAPSGVPDNARRIDLGGATLVPGLGDMFAAAAPDGLADADFYYAMALAHGVTTYRVVGARLPWAAAERDRVLAGDVLAPRLWIGGPRLDRQGGTSFSTRSVPDAAAARREVAEQISLGAEWVSVTSTATPEIVRAVVRAARAGQARVSGEPGATTGAELIRIGVGAIDRLGFFTRSRDDYEREFGARTDYPREDRDAATDYLWQHAGQGDLRPVLPKGAQRAVFVIPMLASFNGPLAADALARDAALPLLPARWRETLLARAHPGAWPGAARATQAAAARGRLVRALASAGARMTTGVDVGSSGYTVPGAGVHRELALLVASGLSPAEAIRAATVNCADLLGAAGALGQIRAGFKADLIAVDGDPLARVEDLGRIKLIVRGGEVLDRDQLLAQARRAAR